MEKKDIIIAPTMISKKSGGSLKMDLKLNTNAPLVLMDIKGKLCNTEEELRLRGYKINVVNISHDKL